ncbi:MAG TPA: AraC family ligand binding domain-containing protein [Gemmatimonadaceae bacterium]
MTTSSLPDFITPLAATEQVVDVTASGVILHVVDGLLEVVANGERRELGPGQLLAMAPGHSHSVRTTTPSEMRLTLHRRFGAASRKARRRKDLDADAAPLFGTLPAGETGPVLVRLLP